ncbi:MAG: hypothetical protein JXA43_01225 [Candidatus Diapherotrites archaeon]|nr:hypothetical protein [Candidatus Diapherotrites archaeon]
MQLEITNKEKQPLLHRTIITCDVKNEKTPTRAEVKKLLSAKLGSDKELLYLQKIETSFGKNDFTVVAKLYDNKEFADKIEASYMKKRNEAKEEADAPKEEPKKEEAKEERVSE